MRQLWSHYSSFVLIEPGNPQQNACIECYNRTDADHVHMTITIPPKYTVSQVIGFIKGKRAIHGHLALS